MTSDESQRGSDSTRVLPFERRKGRPGLRELHSLSRDPAPPPVEDVGKYARGTDEDDYHHRMKANAAAVIVVAVLIVCGVWIANTIAQMRKNQDCVLYGGRSCAPIQVPATPRY